MSSPCYAGWPYIFYLNVAVGGATLLLTRRVCRKASYATQVRRYDPLGAVTVTGALVLLVYAISQAPVVGWSTAWTLAMLAARSPAARLVVIEARTRRRCCRCACSV